MRAMRARQILFIVIIALAWVVRAARADTGAVVVYGKAGQHERQVVGAAITRTVRTASWTVLESAFTKQEADQVVVCLERDRPWPCIAPTATAKGIQRIVVAQVEPENGKSIVITGQVLLDSAAVPSIERRYCEPCNDAALDQSAKELIDVLLQRTSARTGNTAIEIRTIPSGASIMVDGVMSGASDRTIPVAAGLHQVQLQRSGYRPHLAQITVAEGKTALITAILVAADDDRIDHEDTPSRLVPALIGGAGAVALIGGTVYSLRVDPPRQSFQQSRYLYSGPALALAAAGGAAVGIGLYLWFHHPTRRSLPVVSYTNHGGAVGWSTSF